MFHTYDQVSGECSNGSKYSVPITNDDTVEAPLFAEDVLDQPGVLGTMYTTKAPVTAQLISIYRGIVK